MITVCYQNTRLNKYVCSLIFLALSSLCFTGCGYSSAALLPKGMTSIYVENFTNKINPAKDITDRRANYSYRPGLEISITRGVLDAFIFDRHLELSNQKEATLLLKGELVDFRQSPLSYGKNNDVEEYRFEIYVNLELYNNKTGELIWTEKHFMGYTNYSLSGTNSKTESQALNTAVKDLSQRIVERVVENW
ncbi:conserved hypothetical protein, secreted [Candidatus Omnitrophus magneticus]|uniref:Lipoprotein n=1 Tax=Candidatus Omnitrophus magneticus TaxID=1609969 RepID=A0A0F0CQL9_9BACT|nr:conserved hypothetical protein, secreted [Candidatus Omnitrophus magneticus]